MDSEFRSLLKRGNHLNALSSIIILVLLAVVALLMFIVMSGINTEQLWLLRNQFAQILIPGLMLMVILYMADTHMRLRKRLQSMHDQLKASRVDVEEAYDRVSFAHEVATVVTDVRRRDTMPTVLKQSVSHYSADAAAVVSGDDIDVFAAEEGYEQDARSAAMSVAVEVVRTGTPVSRELPDGSCSIAVPLRVKEMLHSVAVLWRRTRGFTESEMEGLKLLARVLELGTENKHLVLELRNQVKGSLGLLTELIEDRQKEYAGHSTNVANLAACVGSRMGVVGEPMEDLKLAALIHDLGMLRIPKKTLELTRPLSDEEQAQVDLHPAIGAELAKAAGLRPEVREAILAHHERIDGSGFPRGLRAFQIPLAARIIAVCDTYDAMARQRRSYTQLSPRQALDEIEKSAGITYDAEVVAAFSAVVTEQHELAALSGLAGVPVGAAIPLLQSTAHPTYA